MPDINPLKAGDIAFGQYSTTITVPVSADLAITKGTIYTSDAAGHLVVIPDVPTVVKGIFQAAVSAPADSTAGSLKVQCLYQRSRFLMKAPAGIVKGDSILVSAAGAAIVAGAKSAVNYIGSVFELYTKPNTGVTKIVTEADDLVIIDMAGV